MLTPPLFTDVVKVFLNLDTLLDLHTDMLAAMQKAPEDLASVFLKERERLLAYATCVATSAVSDMPSAVVRAPFFACALSPLFFPLPPHPTQPADAATVLVCTTRGSI